MADDAVKSSASQHESRISEEPVKDAASSAKNPPVLEGNFCKSCGISEDTIKDAVSSEDTIKDGVSSAKDSSVLEGSFCKFSGISEEAIKDAISSAKDPPVLEGSFCKFSGISEEAIKDGASSTKDPLALEGSFCRFSGLKVEEVKESMQEVKGLVPFMNVSIHEAHNLLNEGFKYLDVRSPKEYVDGHVDGATNVPYMYITEAGRTKNVKFVDEVMGYFKITDNILVGCQSGKRSSLACFELANLGFTRLANVDGGFGDWLKNGLTFVK